MELLACSVVATGCWQEDALVDGTFTQDEWQFLEAELKLPAPDICPADVCSSLVDFGHRLFFEEDLSGPIMIDDPFAPGVPGQSGAVSCASCHDSSRYYIDTRSRPSNVSSGAIHTKHNAMSVVNAAYKSAVARNNCARTDADELCSEVFSWTAVYDDPAGVLELAGRKAMQSNGDIMASAIVANADYLNAYIMLFGTRPDEQAANAVFENIGLALEAYIRQLNSVDSKLDRYIAGGLADDGLTPNVPLGDAEKRGLKLFIGKAMCIECHRGPLLSDLKFHNTGVGQFGERVPQVDLGLGANRGEQHIGKFLTPPLRNVAETAPYMHAGQYDTLAKVIEFYRRGGDSEGFSGIKDARIEPLEIDDDEARDLEAFLRTLTGQPIPVELTKDPEKP